MNRFIFIIIQNNIDKLFFKNELCERSKKSTHIWFFHCRLNTSYYQGAPYG